MRYHFKIHKERGGFWAQCLEIPGCVTQGDTEEELRDNMQEAIDTYLTEPPDSTFLAPRPDKKIKCSRSVQEVLVNPRVAFAFLLRRQRIKLGRTQKSVAKELGMKNLFSYQRLEKSPNVTIEIICKILEIYPSFPIDRVFK